MGDLSRFQRAEGIARVLQDAGLGDRAAGVAELLVEAGLGFRKDFEYEIWDEFNNPWDMRRPARPTVVCLCGSTKFWREFQRAGLRETVAGKIVLSIGAAAGTDDEHFGNLPAAEWDQLKPRLDELHLRKIELADEVLILNVGGYIGESTKRELAHARQLGKPVRWLEPECPA